MQWRIKELTDGGGGAPIFVRIYTHHSWHLYVLEGSGGMLLRKNLKSQDSNDAFETIYRPKYGRFFVFGTLNGGGGRGNAGWWSMISAEIWSFFLFLKPWTGGGGSAGLWSMISAEIWSFFLFLEPWTGGAPANGATNGAWYHYIDVFQMRYAG